MLDSSYPFYFVMNEKGDADNGILTVKLYRFKSTKSKITYIVRVEIYQNHVYAVKFYTKNSRHSKNKYSLMTNTNEPRFIIHTCINIMLSIYKNDKMASFGFIGASSINEDIVLNGTGFILKLLQHISAMRISTIRKIRIKVHICL